MHTHQHRNTETEKQRDEERRSLQEIPPLLLCSAQGQYALIS